MKKQKQIKDDYDNLIDETITKFYRFNRKVQKELLKRFLYGEIDRNSVIKIIKIMKLTKKI